MRLRYRSGVRSPSVAWAPRPGDVRPTDPARQQDRPGGSGPGRFVILRRISAQAAKTSWWRWRESNPRPSTHHQGFSERSLRCLCSAPSIMQTSRCDGPSRCWMSHAYPRPARMVSHLADARHRADDETRADSPLTLLSGSESEALLTVVGSCSFATHG